MQPATVPEIGIAEVSPARDHVGRHDLQKICLAQIGLAEVGFGKHGAGKIDAKTFQTLEAGAVQIGPDKGS